MSADKGNPPIRFLVVASLLNTALGLVVASISAGLFWWALPAIGWDSFIAGYWSGFLFVYVANTGLIEPRVQYHEHDKPEGDTA